MYPPEVVDLEKNVAYTMDGRTPTNDPIISEVQEEHRLSKLCETECSGTSGHVARRDEENLEKAIITCKVSEIRKRGRSPTKALNGLRESTNRNNEERDAESARQKSL